VCVCVCVTASELTLMRWLMLLGRQHLSWYIDYDDYEARTTTTQTDDDDDNSARHYQHDRSTSRLYDKPAAAAAAGDNCDVINQVMECNQPTPTPRAAVQRR